MKITAYNKTDFEKQYYENFQNKDPLEVYINLKTDDYFWHDLLNNKQKSPIINSKNFNSFFTPKYGMINRIKENEK